MLLIFVHFPHIPLLLELAGLRGNQKPAPADTCSWLPKANPQWVAKNEDEVVSFPSGSIYSRKGLWRDCAWRGGCMSVLPFSSSMSLIFEWQQVVIWVFCFKMFEDFFKRVFKNFSLLKELYLVALKTKQNTVGDPRSAFEILVQSEISKSGT